MRRDKVKGIGYMAPHPTRRVKVKGVGLKEEVSGN